VRLLAQVVEVSRGQQLASEYNIKFFETSAKSNVNVAEAFYEIASDIKKRLMKDPPTSGGGGKRMRATTSDTVIRLI